MCDIPKYLQEITTSQNQSNNYLELQLGAKLLQQIFLRSNLHIYQKMSNQFPSLTLSNVVITHCSVNFHDINFQCNIQVSGNSTITAENCTFTPFNNQCECSIEIFCQSKGIFKNCTFRGGNKTAIVVRDRSEGTFEKCAFEDNSNTSLLVLDKSNANIDQCEFKTTNRFSIYLFKNSKSKIFRTKFLQQKGKAIFLLNNSEAYIERCQFKDCEGGGISNADLSKIKVNHCHFSNLGCSAIHSIKNSNAQIMNCYMKKCRGNGVNFEYSTGCVYKSFFSDFDFPAIACFGPKATPVIYDTKVENCQSFAVVSRDCASPLFSKLRIYNAKLSGFSISDFSKAVIENCILKNVQKSQFSIYNGASPTIRNCSIFMNDLNEDENSLLKVFTEGNVIFNDNRVCSENEKLSVLVKNFGEVKKDDFLRNYFYNKNGNDQWKRISIGDNYEVELIEDQSLPNIDICDEYDFDENCNFEEEILNVDFIENDDIEAIIKDMPKPLKEMDVEDFMKTRYPEEYADLDDFEISEMINNFHAHQNEKEAHTNRNENDTHIHHDDVDAVTAGHSHLGICMRCKKEPADHIISPCGHKVLCKKCAQECKPHATIPGMKPEKVEHFCPLCDIPIQHCTEEFVEPKCAICLDHKPDTVILPCGHRCICYECATHLFTEKRQCPLCQSRILSFRYNFQIYQNNE